MRFLLETVIVLALLVGVAVTTVERVGGREAGTGVATSARTPSVAPAASVEPGAIAPLQVAPETAGVRLRFPIDAPPEGRFIGRFGEPRDGGRRAHRGLDIEAPAGTPVLAALAGTVTVGRSPRGGNVVWLEAEELGLRLFYAHLDGSTVSSGDRVAGGTAIGTVGSSGNAATPHLHFEVRDASGTARDPLPLLEPLLE